MDAQLQVQFIHLVASGIGFLVLMLGAWIGYDRYYNAPERKRRIEVEVKLALIEQRLDTGDKRMDALREKDDGLLNAMSTLTEAVTGLKVAVAEMRGAFASSVFKGVGEKDGG